MPVAVRGFAVETGLFSAQHSVESERFVQSMRKLCASTNAAALQPSDAKDHAGTHAAAARRLHFAMQV
jgi:hypothetical protein